MSKVYKYKNIQFKISENTRPPEGDIVYFTSGEWIWIRDQKLSHEEFKVLAMIKKEDFRHPIIPEKDISEAARLANHYGPKCREALKGAGLKKEDSLRFQNVEQKEVGQASEIQEPSNESSGV